MGILRLGGALVRSPKPAPMADATLESVACTAFPQPGYRTRVNDPAMTVRAYGLRAKPVSVRVTVHSRPWVPFGADARPPQAP